MQTTTPLPIIPLTRDGRVDSSHLALREHLTLFLCGQLRSVA
jgi:hypothetical protein